MARHINPESTDDTAAFRLELDLRSDDLIGVKRALRAAYAEVADALRQGATGADLWRAPHKRASSKPGRYSMHLVIELPTPTDPTRP